MRFDYIPYPLWRRERPRWFSRVFSPLLRPWMPVTADEQSPQTPAEGAAYLQRWKLLPLGVSPSIAEASIAAAPSPTQAEVAAPQIALSGPIRLPAQWEPMERILMAFPVLYPPLWETHRQMISAITPAAPVTVLIPTAAWGPVVYAYLSLYSAIELSRVELLVMALDDIWIRDYGPFVGYTADGQRGVVDALFNPLAAYPQQRDDAVAGTWAAHRQMPVRRFEFATEGGNYWSDGQGTLLVSDELTERHNTLTQDEIKIQLRSVFQFEKLIILPRLLREETGHVDLVCKLLDSTTILVNQPNGSLNDERLQRAVEILEQETNAAGQPYRVLKLPFPPLYHNWGFYPVWRSYTNSLTVNQRIVVPIFGLATDQEALDIYRAALPEYTIIGVDCRAAANGGGAVHCLTKEVPK